MGCFDGLLMEIRHWAFHGMPLGQLSGGGHGMALWVTHGDQPMGIPWHALGASHEGVVIQEVVLWGAHGEPPMVFYE